MPRLPHEGLVKAIEDSFAEAGAAAASISPPNAHPLRFQVITGQVSFRIQLTGVTAPLPGNPDGPTILIGYEPNIKAFAGFDLSKHSTFSRRSPSIQININSLRTAIRDGFNFTRKGNDEIAIGFRRDHILAYAMNAEELHRFGADTATTALLTRASRLQPMDETEVNALPVERRRIVSTVSKLSRENDFRNKVIVAYDRKCAITGLQLKLIDAAHILPVGAEGSNDEVANGICLSPTFHRAYDQRLIYLSEDFRMRINPAKEQELIQQNLDGGLHDFKSTLEREIFLPADRRQYPSAEMIRRANVFRQIQAD